MDKEGWIPISVISSFNRVKQLTTDTQLVKDVLTLSTVCQVKGEWVRMNEWRQFVLPTARESIVEESLRRAGTSNRRRRGLEVGESDLATMKSAGIRISSVETGWSTSGRS